MNIRITKIIITLFVAVFLANLTSFCQDFHFSNLHENLYILNPSVITHTEKLSLNLAYRNQWPGTSDFITYNGGIFFTSEKLKSTAGMHFSNDNQGKGIINTTTISFLYGYKTKIGRQLDFAAGLNGNYNIYNAGFSNLAYENMASTSIPANEHSNFFDFSAGVEFGINKKSWVGASVSHINNIASSSNLQRNRKYNVSYTGNYRLNSSHNQQYLYLEPLAVISIQDMFNEIIYGGRLKYEIIYGGLYLRQNLKFQADAFIILLGTSFQNWSFFYTYDINLSGASSKFTKLAAHEVTFLYDIEYNRKSNTNRNRKSNRKGAIKCPKI